MFDRAAKKAFALATGVVLAAAQTYIATRDWLGARREAPFR